MSNESGTGVYVYQQIVKTTAEWEEDKTVPVENVWLFERRTDGKIITKLSDGQHCYTDLPAYGLSAWQAAQMGGYEGTEEEFYESLGTFGEKVEMIENLVSSLSGKFAETPTLESTPTENTLTYTPEGGGESRSFSIGQQCRVYEEDEEDWVFYQLYDIKDGKADWRIAGSGGTSAYQEKAVITLSSNQGAGDSALNGTKVTVKYSDQTQELTWQGTALEVKVPVGMTYEVSAGSVSGYTSPQKQSFTAVGGNERQVVFSYSCEKVTVNVSADDSADCSGRTVTVKNTSGGSVIGSGKGKQVVVKVPTGTGYTVSVDAFTGYTKPADQSFTASQVSRAVSFVYAKIKDAGIVFDKSKSDPQNITGEINSGVIATILSKFRRCLCKKTAEGQVTIAYLNNSNSNQYEDGTTAKLDGTEGDVMVDFPEFYYKWEKVDDNKFRYRFAEYNVDGSFKHVPRSLVGAYKGYMTSNKLYSRSGVNPTANRSTNEFESYATARGQGYQRIDFQQHCVIAFMLYAKYGNRNLQAVLGAGGASSGSSATVTGTSNATGNADTKNETSKYVCGLGIEGVFGGIFEWVKGVEINNRVWKITDPDGSTRNVNAGTSDGWITNVAAENGPFFDMVPTAVGGSETTHYSDYYWQSSGGPLVLARSCSVSCSDGGVAAAGAVGVASGTGSHCGSRLAFRGVIREAESVSAFKALQVL
ncbi:MAG: hypothetical protein KH386_02550 [Bacteroides sp.]|nr:hypothetical protein [Bacteroides sp.]